MFVSFFVRFLNFILLVGFVFVFFWCCYCLFGFCFVFPCKPCLKKAEIPTHPVKWNDPAGQQNKIWASRSSKPKPPITCQPNCLHKQVHTELISNNLPNFKRIHFHLDLCNSNMNKTIQMFFSGFVFHYQCFLVLGDFSISNNFHGWWYPNQKNVSQALRLKQSIREVNRAGDQG